MRYKLHKVIFPDGNYIIMLFDNECTLLHYLHDNLGVYNIKVQRLSFWESIKYRVL